MIDERADSRGHDRTKIADHLIHRAAALPGRILLGARAFNEADALDFGGAKQRERASHLADLVGVAKGGHGHVGLPAGQPRHGLAD